MKEVIFQASEALNLVSFEKFVKSLISCKYKFKNLPSFCFPKSILDNLSASTMQWQWEICDFRVVFFSFLKLEAKKTKVTLNWNCIRLQFCDPLNWIVNFEQPEKLAKKVARLRSVYPIRLHILWTLTTIHLHAPLYPPLDLKPLLIINCGFSWRISLFAT